MPKGGFLGIYLEDVDEKAGPLYVDDINIKAFEIVEDAGNTGQLYFAGLISSTSVS